MVIIKMEPKRAEELLKKLTPISDRSGVVGYLVGLIQDVKRCVEVNLKNDAENDAGDIQAINEIATSLSDVESALSLTLSSAIVKGNAQKEV